MHAPLFVQGLGEPGGLPPGVVRYNNSREAAGHAARGLSGGAGGTGLPPGVIKYPAGGGAGPAGNPLLRAQPHQPQPAMQAQYGPIKVPGGASLGVAKGSRY